MRKADLVACARLHAGGASVEELFATGFSTTIIAAVAGVGLRRVQQLVKPLRPPAPPQPTAQQLDAILRREVAQLGAYYGWGTLRGGHLRPGLSGTPGLGSLQAGGCGFCRLEAVPAVWGGVGGC